MPEPGAALQIGLLTDESRPAEPVARLAMADGKAQLEWSQQAMQMNRQIAPLLYPVEPGLHAAKSRSFSGLHGFLTDSLPDGWGALLMRRRLAKQRIKFDALDGLERLALVGRRGRGALIYEPETTPDDDISSIDLDALAAESQRILLGSESELIETLAKLGGGSGGARPKVHIGFSSENAVCLTDDEIVEGYESWIVKFRAENDPIDIGPLEHAYANMAKAAGITMSATRLLASKEGPGYFATRRFDRPGQGQRIHFLSLAGSIEAPTDPGAIEYDAFLRATGAITTRQSDIQEAFRRMVFNVLGHNRDDHSRQHGYLMDAVGDWTLAPAYDLTYSTGPGGEHYLAIEGEGRRPTRAHVVALGERLAIPEKKANAIIAEVAEAVSRWSHFAHEAGASASQAEVQNALNEVNAYFG